MLPSSTASYINIESAEFADEYRKRGIYFSNIMVWTVLFTFPLQSLLDYIFLNAYWVDLFIVRISFMALIYLVYDRISRRKGNYLVTLHVVMSLTYLSCAIICGAAPYESQLPYFLIFSVISILANTTVFWRPAISLLYCLLAYVVIVIVFSLLNTSPSYEALVNSGGGVFLIISLFSCLLASNRHQLIQREIARNIIIEKSNKKLIDQNEEITEQRLAIEETNRKLQKLSDYRSNTLNIILHDLRNFTGSIQASLELLRDDDQNLTEDQKETLSIIDAANERLTYFAQRLHNSKDTDLSSIEFSFSNFDINDVLGKTVRNLRDAAQYRKIHLEAHLSQVPLTVHLDKIFAEQLLFKLLSNVIRFAQQGGAIVVQSSCTEKYVIIEVEDKGQPIGQERLNSMFHKLESLNSDQQNVNQAGLGFSVAKLLAEAMHGELTYESKEETGNYYHIQFLLA